MDSSIKQIVIIGGGTAGWLTAAILAKEHMSYDINGVQITLIESPDVPSVGVGEGTWPTMRSSLESVGISEYEFIAFCEASFKQGSEFVNWQTDKSTAQNNRYFHPFVAPEGHGQCDLHQFWKSNSTKVTFADFLSYQPHLCHKNLAPKQIQTPEYAAVANYGYHLNAGKFAQLLKQHATTNLGVKFISDHVSHAVNDDNGFIDYVVTNVNGDIKADLFVDCSGSRALLLGQHYGVEIVKQKHILFNDRAIVTQVPYFADSAPIKSHTISTATDFGWIWDIGLSSRRGMGHVYSSEFCSDEQAESILQEHIRQELDSKTTGELQFKKLEFEPGYREKFWHKNCVAIGMASGFIEPLEASALALVELSAKMLAKELPSHRDIMELAAQRFNTRFHYRWQRIIEFLKLHYVLSNRTSPYWQANRNERSIPQRLQQLLKLWKYQPPSYNDFTEIEEIFPSASYQYILYGMGFNTQKSSTSSKYNDLKIAQELYEKNLRIITKYQSGLPTNRQLINSIKQVVSANKN
ncbi:MAG: tryptophan 7-halogenase [Thalassotalea sp.]|nr:tryptophan 7-halogenase [Thalassotalea sp.]